MTRHRESIVQRVSTVIAKPLVGLMIGAIIGAGIGTAWATTRSAEYTATTVYYLRPPATTDATQALTADIYAFNRAKLYESLMTSTELAERVAKRIASKTSPAAMAASISASDIYQTSLITTIVTAKTSDEALRIANGYAAELPGYAGRVEKDSGLSKAAGLITAVDGPTLSSSGTGGPEAIVLAAIVAALLGAAGSWWYRRRYLVVDVLSVASSSGLAVYDQLDLRDNSAVDRMVARLMSEPSVAGSVTVVSPRLGDGAADLVQALSTSCNRLDIAAGSDSAKPGTGLHVRSQTVLDETPVSRGQSDGPALIAVRRSVTSKRNLAAAATILAANETRQVLGVVVIKRVGRAGSAAEASEPPPLKPTSLEPQTVPAKA